jgi:hypothetical protein
MIPPALKNLKALALSASKISTAVDITVFKSASA